MSAPEPTQANIHLSLPSLSQLGVEKDLILQRYPAHHQHVSLQAWDSADEYLINHVSELALPQTAHILILNDDFGALACALSQYDISWQSDSWVARKGCEKNLENNAFDPSTIRFIDSLTPLNESHLPKPDLVLIKLPRSHALLEHQLSALQAIAPETPIIAGGKVKAVQGSVLKLFEKYLGSTTTSLAVKKSRLIFSGNQGDATPKAQKAPFPTTWNTESPRFKIHNHANVFSRTQLDIGARLFMENLPEASNQTVIDLGCGNGVLGLGMLHQAIENDAPIKKMIFVDESTMALASAYLNIEENLPEALPSCDFILSNALDELKSQKANIIVCNPPFHQQNTITDHVAWQMLNDARRNLHTGGELRIVANRHLQHHDKMKRLFGGYRVVASNKKFSILSSTKK